MNARTFILLGWTCCTLCFAADPLTESLEKGLIEEEVNRDPQAAVRAYETAVQHAEAQRRAAATALFRLAESYRKLGRTQDAVVQYQRLVSQYPDQTTLVGLSRTHLAALTPASSLPSLSPLSSAAQRQKELLEQELALVQRLLESKKRQVDAGVASADDLLLVEREALALQRQIVEVESRQRGDLLDVSVPPPATESTAVDTAALLSELKLAEERLAAAEARSPDRTSPMELNQARRELIRLQRLMPENSDPAHQRALIDQAIALAQQHLTNLTMLVAAGRASANDGLQARLDLVALERDRAAAERGEDAVAIAAEPSTPAPDPADVQSLREELDLVNRELLSVQKMHENGKAETTEVRKVQRERLTLERKLPENLAPVRQTELIQQQIRMVEEELEEAKKKIEVGAMPPLGEVPIRRELLGLQRELRGAQRTATSAAPTTVTSAAPAPATRAETDELQRIQILIKDSPDLVNARIHAPGTTGGTPLHGAASSGYFAVVDYLLANAADVNAGDREQKTPLHAAALAGNKRMCERLLAQGAHVDAADENGYTPLHVAALNGYLAVAECLLAAGASVDTKGFVPSLGRQPSPGTPDWAVMESTPLHSAAEKGFPNLVELLLKNRADINARDRGSRTPLIRAILKSQSAPTQILLEHGADPDLVDGTGNTALTYCIGAKQGGFVQLLLDHKADPETRVAGLGVDGQWTALFVPLGKGDVEMCRLLLDRGANVNARADSGITPVHHAVVQNAPATLRLLLERKPEVDVRDSSGNRPLDYALEHPKLENVEALLQAGADPNAPGWDGGETKSWPPLARVAMADGERWPAAVAEALLKHGANVNATNGSGWTPLHQAVSSRRADLVELLLAHKAEVNACGNAPKSSPALGERPAQSAGVAAASTARPRRIVPRVAGPAPLPPFSLQFGFPEPPTPNQVVTPLHVAAGNNDLELARLLLGHGADANARDAAGHTPLYFATHQRDLEMMTLLLEAKADPNAKDNAGETLMAAVNTMAKSPHGLRHQIRGQVWQAESTAILGLLLKHGATPAPSDAAAASNDSAKTNAPTAAVGAQVVRVLGQVNKPGVVEFKERERLDIIDAIARCGGFTDGAQSDRIVLTRGGKEQVLRFDSLKTETDPQKKIWLQPGDLIEVKLRAF